MSPTPRMLCHGVRILLQRGSVRVPSVNELVLVMVDPLPFDPIYALTLYNRRDLAPPSKAQ